MLTDETPESEPVLSLSTSAGTLQIVASPEGAPRGYVDLRRAATKEHLGQGIQPLVASVGDLAGMAAALHRDQDAAALTQLRRIAELEVNREQTLAPNPSRAPQPRRATSPRPRRVTR